jgi:hypothetical protein
VVALWEDRQAGPIHRSPQQQPFFELMKYGQLRAQTNGTIELCPSGGLRSRINSMLIAPIAERVLKLLDPDCMHPGLIVAPLPWSISAAAVRNAAKRRRQQKRSSVGSVRAGLVPIGPMLFSSDPDMYYLNLSFRSRWFCWRRVIFHFTLRRKLLLGKMSASLGELFACISLALWSA